MSKQQFRGRFLIASLLIILVAVTWYFSPWFTAGAVGLLIIAVIAFNYRRFVVMSSMQRGLRAFTRGQYGDAESALRETLTSAQKFGMDDYLLGVIYGQLCSATKLQGNFTDAERFGVLALEAVEKVCGACDPETLFAQEQLARLYVEIARYILARPLLEKSLQIRQLKGEVDKWGSGPCLQMLIDLWTQQGAYERAEPYLRQLLAVEKAPDLPEGIALAAEIATMMELAENVAQQRRFDEAESLVRAALDKLSKVQIHAYSLAICLRHQASIQRLQERFGEAEKLANEALTRAREAMRPNQPELAVYLNLLATILAQQGKWRDAEPLCQEALRLRDAYLAPEHPYVAESCETYASVLEQAGRHDEAHTHRHRAAYIRDFHTKNPID